MDKAFFVGAEEDSVVFDFYGVMRAIHVPALSYMSSIIVVSVPVSFSRKAEKEWDVSHFEKFGGAPNFEFAVNDFDCDLCFALKAANGGRCVPQYGHIFREFGEFGGRCSAASALLFERVEVLDLLGGHGTSPGGGGGEYCDFRPLGGFPRIWFDHTGSEYNF